MLLNLDPDIVRYGPHLHSTWAPAAKSLACQKIAEGPCEGAFSCVHFALRKAIVRASCQIVSSSFLRVIIGAIGHFSPHEEVIRWFKMLSRMARWFSDQSRIWTFPLPCVHLVSISGQCDVNISFTVCPSGVFSDVTLDLAWQMTNSW
jgi:hypothetical protein